MTVKAVEDDTDLFGKTADELQYGITMKGNVISGTLKQVTDYTGFSSEEEDQEGHYLAMKYEPTPSDSSVYVELVNGTVGERKLDEDHIMILKIADPKEQSIKVRVVNDDSDEETTSNYSISGLVLE